MPGTVKKTNGYRGTWGGKTVAKSTTKAKAEAQQRLLRGVEHGWKPTGKPSRLAKMMVRKHRNKKR